MKFRAVGLFWQSVAVCQTDLMAPDLWPYFKQENDPSLEKLSMARMTRQNGNSVYKQSEYLTAANPSQSLVHN